MGAPESQQLAGIPLVGNRAYALINLALLLRRDIGRLVPALEDGEQIVADIPRGKVDQRMASPSSPNETRLKQWSMD